MMRSRVPILIFFGLIVSHSTYADSSTNNFWTKYANSPIGYHMNWGSAHWIPGLHKMLAWGGDSHNYKGNNSVRVFDPVTNRWDSLWPNDWTKGVQNRDNHVSFYVPHRGASGEFWVLGGSYSTADPPGPLGTNFGGRFDIVKKTWVNVAQSQGEFSRGLIKGFQWPVYGLTNPAHAWCPELDTGVMFAGSVSPEQLMQLIEPNPDGPEPYKFWSGVLPGSPPPMDQVRTQGVCVGKSFYVYGPAKILWRLDVRNRKWTQLASGGQGGAQLVMTYDSTNNVFVLHGGRNKRDVWIYHLDTNTWENMTPTMKMAGDRPRRRAIHVGVYAPSVNQHIYTGGFIWNEDGTEADWQPSLHVDGYRYAGGPPSPSSPGPVSYEETPERSRTDFAIALKTWVARPLPGFGKGPCPTGCKHMRLAHNPNNGRIYFLGGDYDGPKAMNSGRNELYSYSVVSGDWRPEYPYCGLAGNVQPDHPDEVGWTWDSRRNLFWMLPGFLFSSPEATNCPGGATLVHNRVMTFDPATLKWTDVGPSAPTSGSEHGKFAFYDPVRDEIGMLRWDGGLGSVIDIFSPVKKNWQTTSLAWSGGGHGRGEYLNDAQLDKEYMAADLDARKIYVIDPTRQRLLRIDMSRWGVIDNLGPVPAHATADATIPVWDSINRVLLWPQIRNLDGNPVTLYVYHPDTRRWERDLMVQPDGLTVRGNSAVFDPQHNVLLIMGGLTGGDLDPTVRHFFLYRYGNGSPAQPGGPRPDAPRANP